MRRLIDVSVVLGPGTPEWPGDVPFSCGWTCTIAGGASINLSAMTLSPHVGTHADAPLHVHDGWAASDALPVDKFVGPALVLDVSDVAAGADPEGPGALTLAMLDARADAQGFALRDALMNAPRLLLRTGRTIADGVFPDGWPWVAPEAVRVLVAGGMCLLGVDAPSVDARESKTLATHHALFGAGAYNVENLDLRGVPTGRYELIAPPLRVAGLDGAPVRALLRADR
ncbi:MAG: cyclase family protein [Gemmatirosa sp.]